MQRLLSPVVIRMPPRRWSRSRCRAADCFPRRKDELAGGGPPTTRPRTKRWCTTILRAIKLFEQLESRYPLRPLRAAGHPGDRIRQLAPTRRRRPSQAADRFIRHVSQSSQRRDSRLLLGAGPVHLREDRPYIGYVRARPVRNATRREMRSSSAVFKELTTKFPDSMGTYQDSIRRMRYLTNAMATYEVKVASYYYKRGAYVAAANRAQGALVNFPQTPANEKAPTSSATATEAQPIPTPRRTRSRSSPRRILKAAPSPARATRRWQFWKRREDHGVKATGQMATGRGGSFGTDASGANGADAQPSTRNAGVAPVASGGAPGAVGVMPGRALLAPQRSSRVLRAARPGQLR